MIDIKKINYQVLFKMNTYLNLELYSFLKHTAIYKVLFAQLLSYNP